MLNLSNLKISRKSKTKRIELGRGNASGRGNFSTRGVKGQRSRTGGGNKLYRLGMRHIIMQTPKLRGFASIHPKPAVLNLNDLEKAFQLGEKVTPGTLKNKGLIDSSKMPVKILAEGQISKSLIFAGCQFSKSAEEKIKKAGGKIEIPKVKEKVSAKK